MNRASYVTETQIVRRIARNPACQMRFGVHAPNRMAERDITEPDVRRVLMNGHGDLSRDGEA
jgi:hypothetical protein